MSVTLSEIARELGVSPMTVSRALRGVGRIGSGTRDRVLAAATRHGYRPNSSARAMRSGRSGCVALLLSTNIGYSFLPQDLMWGIEDALEEQGMYLTLARIADDKLAAGKAMPRILCEWMAEGMLVNYTKQIPQAMVDQVRENGVPSIWINAKRPADCVYPADIEAGVRATRYLLDLGHTRIAYADYRLDSATDISAEHYSTVDRYEGYARAMKAARLKSRWLKPEPGGERVAFTRRILSAPDRPTAVVSYAADFTAVPVLYAAATLGLRVPQDLSVLSFHNTPLDELGLKLTTMTVMEHAVGSKAVEMLLEKIANPDKQLKPVQMPLELTMGNSCGPV